MNDAGDRREAGAGTLAAAAVGAAAVALCDALHELGHVAAALPLGVPVLMISSVGISTATSSPAVALAGPLVNAVLAGALLVARSPALAAESRCVAWLFGTVNLFDCVAYLLYSALLGSGDWATVFAAFSPPLLWRPAVALAGAALYAGAVFGSLRVLRALVADGALSCADARRWCLTAYWAGGLLLTAAAALNPIDAWLILTSGVATGFGAMAGLTFIPSLLKDDDGASARKASAARVGLAWLLVCVAVSLAFVFVLGPGIRLSVADAGGERQGLSSSTGGSHAALLRRPSA